MTTPPRPTLRALLRHWADRILGPSAEHTLAIGAPTIETAVLDVAKPVVADLTGQALGHTHLDTTVLQALTPAVIAELDAAKAAAAPASTITASTAAQA